ncbi:hypothetical protein GTZ99_12310 [Novosphingobium sp. FSY-8]|uniref:Uncharacterized protein n=1 Tax=Novosphingobium ovatum TaxID=1908523 RepID=A0ABW9XFK2_9SPHN|nr:hypothetical protein [Novosphingobium ovatum]NBC37333.1 hypothetical protein [Novosphingobium ovatum]
MADKIEWHPQGTPGPWQATYQEKRENHVIETAYGGWREAPVAFTANHFVGGNEPANARAIAQVPAMVAVMRSMTENGITKADHDTMRAILARIDGADQ